MPAEDGGFYAIKGFLYQFDKTLIEVLEHPEDQFTVENIQDIDCQAFVIQVKHHAAQDYAPSKIRRPIIQIIELFQSNPAKKYCLYCHFKDKPPQEHKLELEELDKILGTKDKDIYSPELKRRFVESFQLTFSHNYEEQFLYLASLIEKGFSLREGMSFLYHSIIRSKLLNIAVLPDAINRTIKKSDLDSYLNQAEKYIFYTSYSKYLERAKYESLVKREYFTIKVANLNNFERLFTVDFDGKINKTDILRIITQISKKYYRSYKSPAPYISIRSIQNDLLNGVKRELIDLRYSFSDGTQFDGDKFRLDYLKGEGNPQNKIVVKIINEPLLESIAKEIPFQEVFSFYLENPPQLELPGKRINIQIEQTDQILKFI